VIDAMSAMPAQLHIASIVVHAAPARAATVAEAVAAVPDARIHATSANGKVVVTLEAPNLERMTSDIESIRRIAGVLSVVLVYQCADTLEAMNQEMP
jgi:periplasmic nitrate reductase NapD